MFLVHRFTIRDLILLFASVAYFSCIFIISVRKKKSERDYRALLDYMQENEISAEEAISKLQSENTEKITISNNDKKHAFYGVLF